MSPSNYPGSFDTFATSGLSGAVVGATDHQDKGDALNKIERELGVNPSGSFADVTARFASIGTTGGFPTVNVLDHGADPTGASDSQSALVSAIAALPATGGTFLVPGKFIHSGTLDFSGKRAVVIRGVGGMSSGLDTASQLVYTGSTSTTAYNFQGCVGLTVKDIWLRTSVATFASRLIDLRGDTTAATQISFENVFILAPTTATGATLVDISGGSHVSDWYSCHFNGGGLAVLGGKSTPVIVNNTHRFYGCHFQNHTLVPIQNPTHVWTFHGCTWQNILSGAAGAVNFTGSNVPKALSFYGCWMGDSSASGIWIECPGNTAGLTVSGCQIGPAAKGIVVGTFSFGVTITGNELSTNTIPYEIGTNPTSLLAMGNNNGSNVPVVTAPIAGSIWETTGNAVRHSLPVRTVTNATEPTATAFNAGEIWFNSTTGTFRGSTGSGLVSLS